LDAVEHDVTCAECGAKMSPRFHDWRQGRGRQPFYGCSQYPDCQGRHGAHIDGRPLGKPGNKATRATRMRAHAVLDRLWKGKDARMSRTGAYVWMQKALGLLPKDAHIGSFDEERRAHLISSAHTMRKTT